MSQPGDRIDILGVPVDRVTAEDAAERVAGYVEARTPAHVVTVNPEFVMTAQRNPEFMAALRASDLAVADGVGIVWAARLLGEVLEERVAGVDLVPRLAATATALGRSVFLLGAAPGVAESAAATLGAVNIAGTHSGSPADCDVSRILSLVERSDPAIVFVAFGSPAQDLWIARHRHEIGHRVCMGVGGAFDFLAGNQRRAPSAVRRAGMEWLWRLGREPWRWRRQLALPQFAAAVARSAVHKRARRDRTDDQSTTL